MLSEFELIKKYFDRPARSAALGVGDDAALLRPSAGMELAVSTDLLLEGRHFPSGADARKLGHKALAVNLSDMAAMGAAPRWVTLALALPAANEAWLDQFAMGFFALAERFGVELIGGDTTRGPLTICVTILGEVPKGLALFRAGAHAGDDIWVSGQLGDAALALVQPGIAAAARRLDEPEPRVELGERLRGLASAAIDVSDGFAQDLGHILARSGVGAVVEYGLLPRSADVMRIQDENLQARLVLSGGDDYELAFTAPQASRPELVALSAEFKLALSRVGSIRAGEATLEVIDAHGRPMAMQRGFDHFAP
ncbi:MAG: thiamine-phosphate kinase [Betaproteobacteria bacterium]